MAQVQSPPNLPEYKSLEKVQAIPLVHDSLSYAHSVFSSNPYTSYVYTTGLGLSTTAYNYSKPVQARLAPLIDRADGVALQGLNAVESRFPYPFQTPTEDVRHFYHLPMPLPIFLILIDYYPIGHWCSQGPIRQRLQHILHPCPSSCLRYRLKRGQVSLAYRG